MTCLPSHGRPPEQPIDISQCRVLVIDDALSTQKLIAAYLSTAGLYKFEFAGNGRDALAKVEAFEPDLIILDIVMPEMDGYEFCRHLRARPQTADIPILVETALETLFDRTAVFQAGATDLVTKPLHGAELKARVRLHLEKRLLIESLQGFRRTMQTELDVARQMQENLLPNAAAIDSIGRSSGIHIRSHFQPSAELGGDLWVVQPLGEGLAGVAIVDFSGHGLSASLNTFRLHTMMSTSSPQPRDPADYVTALNFQLVDLLPTHQFATMFYAVIDTNREIMTYVAAGSPCPIIGTPDVRVLDVCGLPLGITRKAQYVNQRVAFPAGSFLLLYSDALSETPDLAGDCLNGDRLVELVRECRKAPTASSPLAALVDRFNQSRTPIADDLTLVWLQSDKAVTGSSASITGYWDSI